MVAKAAVEWLRIAILAFLVPAWACSREPAPPPPPAVAGPDTLSVEVLSNWMVLGQPLPLSVEVADGLARHWGEMTALALLEPGRLRDADFVASVVWPEVRGAVLDSALSRRAGPPPPLSSAEVEAVFQRGELRMVARVLRRASPEAHPEERQRQRDEAFDIRGALTRGGSWNEAVARSEDEATRGGGGLLGLVGRGELEPGLERAAFELEPGAISPVVESREGYQILFRPRLEDVRELFEEGLLERQDLVRRAFLMDSLVALRTPVLDEGAGSRILALAEGGRGLGEGGSPLARWEGGVLSDSTAIRYLTTLPREDRRRLVQGLEDDATDLVTEIARQEILWQELAPRGDPEVLRWESQATESVRKAWLAGVEPLDRALGTDEDTDVEARRSRITEYMEAVISRRRAPLPAPPAAVGRAAAKHPVHVHAAGLQSAVERARRLLDSAENGG